MTRPAPRLVAVEPPASTPEPAEGPRGGAHKAFWVLAALVFVCALTAAFQTRQVADLNREVAGLNGELATARTQIQAYQGRMGEIRDAVTHLQRQLGELDDLAQRDPLDEASR